MSTQELLTDLSDLLDQVAEVDLDAMDRDELTQWTLAWPAIEAKVAGLAGSAMAAADRLQVQADGGQRSLAAFVAHHTRSAPEHVGARLRLGRFLREAPGFATALQAGVISLAHVEAMRNALNNRNRPSFAADEDALLGAATSLDVREFDQVVQCWDNAADPDGTKPKAQRDKRAVSTRKLPDGCVEGNFRLDPLAGETFLNALHLESERLRKEDLHLPKGHQPRTRNQLAADALTNLVTRGAARNAQGRLPKPLLSLVLSEQVAEDLRRWLTDPTVTIATDPFDWDRRCHLPDGTQLHPHLLAGALDVAVLRRLVMSSESEILDLGVEVRCFPAKLAEAIKIRDGGRCRMQDGCDAPYQWLEIDHVQPFRHFGSTSTGNGRCGCQGHNRNDPGSPPPPHRRT